MDHQIKSCKKKLAVNLIPKQWDPQQPGELREFPLLWCFWEGGLLLVVPNHVFSHLIFVEIILFFLSHSPQVRQVRHLVLVSQDILLDS